MAAANPLIRLLDTNKLKGADNYFEWEMNIRLVLEFKKLTYVTVNLLPVEIDHDSTLEERETLIDRRIITWRWNPTSWDRCFQI